VTLTNCQSIVVKFSNTDNENATEACYRESYLIALAEVHTVAEILIKTCAVKMATFVFGEQSKNKVETV
jgi:hypothetical protein